MNTDSKTDLAHLLAEGQQIVHFTSDAKYRHKVEMINLVLSGLSPSYLSTYYANQELTKRGRKTAQYSRECNHEMAITTRSAILHRQ